MVFEAPDGARVSTGTTIESEAVKFKIRKLAELRIGLPHIKRPMKGAMVDELLHGHLAHMRRQGRKSTKRRAGIDEHVRRYFGDRVASTLTTADFEQHREARLVGDRHAVRIAGPVVQNMF